MCIIKIRTPKKVWVFIFLLLTRVRNKGSLKRRDADVGIVSRLFSPRLSRTRVIWYLYGCWLGLYKYRKSVRVGAARILVVFWVGGYSSSSSGVDCWASSWRSALVMASSGSETTWNFSFSSAKSSSQYSSSHWRSVSSQVIFPPAFSSKS